VITPTPTPFISPDTLQQAKNNLWFTLLQSIDEFGILFLLVGGVIAFLLGRVWFRRKGWL